MWTVSIPNKYCLVVGNLGKEQSMCLPWNFGGGKENLTKHCLIRVNATTTHAHTERENGNKELLNQNEYSLLDRIANWCEIALLPHFFCVSTQVWLFLLGRHTTHVSICEAHVSDTVVRSSF